jgi:hypothetical protein
MVLPDLLATRIAAKALLSLTVEQQCWNSSGSHDPKTHCGINTTSCFEPLNTSHKSLYLLFFLIA